MKNSKKPDRELAKIIGCSQPTVTRTRRKLEKEGYIREYTLIPDFRKLGYEILCLTFVKLRKRLSKREVEKARKIAREYLKANPFAVLMLERGMGLGYDGAIISLHENYRSHIAHINRLRQFDFLDITKIDSFIMSFDDEVHYRPLSFVSLANHLLTKKEKEE